MCRNVDRVLPYRHDAFWKLGQKRAKINHAELKALIPLPPSLRWVKWVVKCPSTELNIAYKIYMVCKEVLYMITPLIRTGERENETQSIRKRESQNKATRSELDMSKNRWEESSMPMLYFVHAVMSPCFSVISQMRTFLHYIALKRTIRELNQFNGYQSVSVLPCVSE